MIGSFGPAVFEVSTERLYLINQFARKSGARIEEHEVSGGKPISEFIAPALDEVNFSIFLHAGHGVNPLEEIEKLRNICHEGQYYRLVIGGQNLGQFLITAISEDHQSSNGTGQILIIRAEVSFKEYV